MLSFKKVFLNIILVLFILTVSITLTINSTWLYLIDIKQLNLADTSDLSESIIVSNFKILMDYLNYFWIKDLVMPDFPTSKSGAFHFYEVKLLFQLNYLVLVLTSIPSIYYLKQLMSKKKMWTLIRPFSGLLVVLAGLVSFMIIGFDRFFVLFHQVFFNNDDWLFDPVTDPIITVLPETYFFHCFILFFVLFVGAILLCIYVGKKQLKNYPYQEYS